MLFSYLQNTMAQITIDEIIHVIIDNLTNNEVPECDVFLIESRKWRNFFKNISQFSKNGENYFLNFSFSFSKKFTVNSISLSLSHLVRLQIEFLFLFLKY